MEVLSTTNFQPDIVVAGLRIGEPVIALTGILVMLVCFYAWFRLGKIAGKDDALRLSRIFFLLTGFSTLVGAVVGHCFLYCLPFAFKAPGWLLGMIAVSAMEQASIVRARPYLSAWWGRGLSWLNIGELILALWFVSATLWFPGVEIHSAFGLLGIVAPLEALLFFKTGNSGSKLVLYGIAGLFAAVLIHILKFSFGVWFCYFDIAHLFMALAIWYFMLGVEQSAKPEKSVA